MRLRRAFRPSVSELLEDRVVPSAAVTSPSVIVLGHAIPLPPQMDQNAQVRAAFAAFTLTYAHAVDGVLLAPGPDGSINAPANRPAFDAAVRQALDILANDLVGALGDVPVGSVVVTEVVDDIIGDDPESLESQLMAAATSSIEQATAAGTLSSNPLLAVSQAYARAIGQTVTTDLSPVPQAGASAPAAATLSPHAAAAAPSSSVVQAAFGSFLNAYYQAVRDVLLAPGPSAAIDPVGHRAAFDATVSTALHTLAARLTNGLDNGSATNVLAGRIEDALVGDDPTSLEAQLAALPTPAGADAALVRAFTLGSFRTVMESFALIAGDASQFSSAVSVAN